MTANSYSSPDDAPGEGGPEGVNAEVPDTSVPMRTTATDSDANVRELGDIPAIEVITRAIVMLMSASAEKLGLAEGTEDQIDLDEARRLITSLAGLVQASGEYLGVHAAPIRDGLKGLQLAFREASAYPDEPGQGPGEKYSAPVRAPRR